MYISGPDLSPELQTPIPNFLLDASTSKNLISSAVLHKALSVFLLPNCCSSLFQRLRESV